MPKNPFAPLIIYGRTIRGKSINMRMHILPKELRRIDIPIIQGISINIISPVTEQYF